MPAVFRITLNRPQKRNALDAASIQWLRGQLSQASIDAEARVILLRGEGTDFCSGADLSAIQKIRDSSILENFDDAKELRDLFLQMRRHRLPIIAAVHGRALAGGCGLATACDLILASESAQFGYPEVRIGFVPAMVMAILRRSVSEKVAFDLLTTGRPIGAREALDMGLINAVYPETEFEAAVEKYAGEMAARPASAVQLTKELLYHMDALPFESAIHAGAQVNAIARMSEECRQGIDRFLKKE
ncbi:MAG: enoyl-CoA hydratase/isomerase family protein [Candidatus Solibacter usitatus]|nr:enoyl-CoA hydratase/isomerase family protein [Candidatus Solibacter usitatus]